MDKVPKEFYEGGIVMDIYGDVQLTPYVSYKCVHGNLYALYSTGGAFCSSKTKFRTSEDWRLVFTPEVEWELENSTQF